MFISSNFFVAINSVFNITIENNSYSIITPGHWNCEDGEKLMNKLNNFFELRSENDNELLVKEIEKRSTPLGIGDKDYN